MNSITIIEDDQQLRDMLLYFLTHVEGYNVSALSSGENAVDKVIEFNPSLVLVDVQLPHTDGLQVLTELRSKGFLRPIIVMTANDTELVETNALSLGANDYITKPVRTSALRARIKNQLLISNNSTLFKAEPHTTIDIVDISHIELFVKHQYMAYKSLKLNLQTADIELLMILANNEKPQPVCDIFFQIHGFECPVGDRSIYMRISSLRKKVAALWPELELIKNHRSKGFYLCYKVHIR